jgi:phospholipid-binding lipoprotein MlaA
MIFRTRARTAIRAGEGRELLVRVLSIAFLILLVLDTGPTQGFQERDGAGFGGPSHVAPEKGDVEVASLVRILMDQGEGSSTPVRLAALRLEASPAMHAPGYTLVLSNAGPQEKIAQPEGGGDEGLEEEEVIDAIPDPFRPVNKALFVVNDKLYVFFFRPVAMGYKAVVPDRVRVGVRNMFANVLFPVRFVNCLLQGKVEGAFSEMGRFLLNTFCGAAGFVDVASEAGVFQRREEDTDQTLGVYGLGTGPYIFWPVLGPSSARGTVGLAGDYFLSPITYIETAGVVLGVIVFLRINDLSLRVDDYDAFLKAAIDPYTATRNAYYQNRKAKIEE